jgi:hypothetical protein
MNIYTPYTYLIGWSKHNKWYYGVRFAKDCHPSDLWNTYFTSSKKVRSFREEHGEPDIIQIRKQFFERDSACKWESKVLKRLRVINEEKWLNQTDNKSIPIESTWKDKKYCKKMKKIRSSKEFSEKISNATTLLWKDEEYRGKVKKSKKESKKVKDHLIKQNELLSDKWKNDKDFRESMMKKRNDQLKSENHRKKVSEANKLYMWITDGVINKRVKKESIIIENFRRGRTIKNGRP